MAQFLCTSALGHCKPAATRMPGMLLPRHGMWCLQDDGERNQLTQAQRLQQQRLQNSKAKHEITVLVK